MISSMAFESSAFPCAIDILASNAWSVGASISDTTVQYCSAETSVMMRILGMPDFSPIFESALNLSTIARTLPGLQYMMSRTIYIDPSQNGGTMRQRDLNVGAQESASRARTPVRQGIGACK